MAPQKSPESSDEESASPDVSVRNSSDTPVGYTDTGGDVTKDKKYVYTMWSSDSSKYGLLPHSSDLTLTMLFNIERAYRFSVVLSTRRKKKPR